MYSRTSIMDQLCDIIRVCDLFGKEALMLSFESDTHSVYLGLSIYLPLHGVRW